MERIKRIGALRRADYTVTPEYIMTLGGGSELFGTRYKMSFELMRFEKVRGDLAKRLLRSFIKACKANGLGVPVHVENMARAERRPAAKPRKSARRRS